jgi:hypothetical protein
MEAERSGGGSHRSPEELERGWRHRSSVVASLPRDESRSRITFPMSRLVGEFSPGNVAEGPVFLPSWATK